MPEFRRHFLGKWFVLGLFAIAVAVAVAFVAAVVRSDAEAPLVGFTVLWLISLGWNAYWWLFRIAVALRLDGDVLLWDAPLSSGAVPLDGLTAVRPMPLVSKVEVFDLTVGRPVLIIATKGLGAFLEELSATRPDLPVRLGWQGRWAERLPGWSGWRNGDDR